MAFRTGFTTFLLFFFPVPLSPQTIGEPIQFESHGSTLQGILFRTSEASAPGVILLHGWQGGEGDVLGLGEALSQAGWNVLAFNYRGVYKSDGTYSLANSIEDVGTAAEFMRGAVAIVGEDLPTAAAAALLIVDW